MITNKFISIKYLITFLGLLLNAHVSAAIRVNQNDAYAIVHKKDGTSFKQELFLGSTYLSSSSRMLNYADPVVSVTIFDNKGMKREIAVNSK